MTTYGRTIVGIFNESSMADNAVSALEDQGFNSDQIYYSARNATSGGFLAGLKSLFTGEDTTGGSVSNDFANMGFSGDEAQYYENEYQAGRSLVAVRAGGREQDAATLLQTNGAQIYGSRVANDQTAYANDYAQSGQTTYPTDERETSQTAYTNDYNQGGQTTYPTNDVESGRETYANDYNRGSQTFDDANDAERKIRLREEQLNVGKQTVQTGEVGLHKEIVSERKEVDVPVSHEEVYIERRPVSEGQLDNENPISESEHIRVPVREEQVNVDKDTVVTGEVAVNRRTVQGTQRVGDTVKREELKVDQQGDIPVQDSTYDNTNE